MADPNNYDPELEMRNVGRDNAIGLAGPRRRKKKGKMKSRTRRKKKGKPEEKKDFDIEADPRITDPITKLQRAHPRHVIKVILKKLIQKPSIYRMLGSLGMALKSSGIDLSQYLLSSSNKLPKAIRKKMRYDVNDMRMLIIARLCIHKMLIREGTTLKSVIHRNGTYPEPYDSDDDNTEINTLPIPHRNLKKTLKYVSNQQVAQTMQNTEPQEILNALSYADKHKLYELFKKDVESVNETDGGATELHQLCTAHVSFAPQITEECNIPTVLKCDEKEDNEVNEDATDIMIANIKNEDNFRMMSDTYQYEEYYADVDGNNDKIDDDHSLLSCLQTQIDILVRYNHIAYKHLNMMLYDKSCLPSMYVSLSQMVQWELERENEIEILTSKRKQCRDKYGGDIDELNMRKALLAREINETKVSLERIKYEIESMRKLYENAKSELNRVNELTTLQDMERDAYLTKFDEKWTFEWPVRAQFHRQTKLNAAIKTDAKHWSNKLDEIKRYNDSGEIWENLKEDIWKFGNDNKKISEHYIKLNAVNKSRESIYFGSISFWNEWYLKHCTQLNHAEDQKRLASFYNDILLKGTEKNDYFDFNRDTALFGYEHNTDINDIWSYRDHIYNMTEHQIDISQTELPMTDLWKLVQFQEKGEIENYKQYAFPKLWKFEQEQLEIERRERLKEIDKNEKKKRKQKRKHRQNMSTAASLKKMISSKQKIPKLHEEDEDDDDDGNDKKYQSQLNFINNLGGTHRGIGGDSVTTGTNRTLVQGFSDMDSMSTIPRVQSAQFNNFNSQYGVGSQIGTIRSGAFGMMSTDSNIDINNMRNNIGGRSRKNTHMGGIFDDMASRQGSTNTIGTFGTFGTPRTNIQRIPSAARQESAISNYYSRQGSTASSAITAPKPASYSKFTPYGSGKTGMGSSPAYGSGFGSGFGSGYGFGMTPRTGTSNNITPKNANFTPRTPYRMNQNQVAGSFSNIRRMDSFGMQSGPSAISHDASFKFSQQGSVRSIATFGAFQKNDDL